ncbi:hypothetical protein J4233_06250 [Candidatus Pacearchaeota archaeon]|nr:hypothetical protein [Candidatus Pacearchaeota archaeon]
MQTNHPLDAVEIRGNDPEKVRGLLRLLPVNTFPFVREFQKGSAELKEEYCGQIGIYAQESPYVGKNGGVMLIIINEHLFGNPTTSEDNPLLRVPNGATNILIVPPRQSPLKKDHPFMGTEFSYRGVDYLLGYELSGGAHAAIINTLVAAQRN